MFDLLIACFAIGFTQRRLSSAINECLPSKIPTKEQELAVQKWNTINTWTTIGGIAMIAFLPVGFVVTFLIKPLL